MSVRIPRTARRRGAGYASLVVTAALVLAGCGGGSDGGDGGQAAATASGGAKLVHAGRLTTCTHLPYAPFQFEQDGKVVGFDVDLIDLVAKKLGVTQQIVDTPFEGIKSGQDLDTGKCDIAAAGMTITPERQQVLDFTDPYFDATQALLAKKGAGYDSLESLKGKKLGVQAGTTGKDYVTSRNPDGVEIVEFEDSATEEQAVATGQVDAAVNDLPVWLDYVKKNGDRFEVGGQFDTGEQYGFAVRKGGNPQLLKTANQVLAAAKADGTYDRLYEKWFGTKPKSS